MIYREGGGVWTEQFVNICEHLLHDWSRWGKNICKPETLKKNVELWTNYNHYHKHILFIIRTFL